MNREISKSSISDHDQVCKFQEVNELEWEKSEIDKNLVSQLQCLCAKIKS